MLLLALYILLKKHGIAPVTKRHALRFVETKGLMNIPNEERADRSKSDTIWENDLAWKRQDLVNTGLMSNSGHDSWQLSDKGIVAVEEWAQRILRVTEAKVDWRREWDGMTEDDIVLNPETIEWLLKIAQRKL